MPISNQPLSEASPVEQGDGPCVISRFVENSSKFPNQTAIEYRGKAISYSELLVSSGRIAAFLTERGTEKSPVVVVALRDRAQFIAAMLGVLRAETVFVPVDDSWPVERIGAALSQVEPEFLIADRGFIDRIRDLEIASLRNSHLLSLTNEPLSLELTSLFGRLDWDLSAYPQELALQPIDPDALSYIYFTSGSTGRPKGIAGRMRGINHFIAWEAREFGLEAGTRVSQLTSPTFDAFFRDILLPLSIGGTICVPPAKTAEMDLSELVVWLDEARIEHVHCVPSLFRSILEGTPTSEHFSSLKAILLSGEAPPVAALEEWRNVFGDRIELVNLYGSTETTMTKFFHRIRSENIERGIIPIGRPIDGVEAFLLDEAGQDCSPGDVGEIYVRTPHRTLGYFKDPEATEKVFVPNPRSSDPDDIVYRTGDLGLITEYGDLQFVGRRDRQVKVNGIRVELDEIKTTILAHATVCDCAVIMRELGENRSNLIAKDGSNENCGEPASPRIVAYVVPRADFSGSDLREFLVRRLPEYMIPARILSIEAMPLNSNGKLDLQALPAPDRVRPELSETYEKPNSPVECELAAIWKEALSLDAIGVNDSFFELGGDSLLALRITNRLRDRFSTVFSVRDLFERDTIRKLAERMDCDAASECSFVISTQARPAQYFPLSLSQRGLWYLWQLDPDNPYYTTQGLIQIRGELDRAAFRDAWWALLSRHEGLRARFLVRDGEPMQEFVDLHPVEIPATDLSSLRTESAQQAAIREMAAQWIADPIDLEIGPIVRFHMFRHSDRAHTLLVSIHEIATDLWSVRAILNDLQAFYHQRRLGESLDDVRLQTSFGDYVVWESSHCTRDRLRADEVYWRSQLEGHLPVLELPFDRPRPAAPSYQGKQQRTRLSSELTRRLNEVSRRHKSTLFMTLLSGFKVLLRNYSRQDDFVIGAPLANRNCAESEPLTGFFLNMLPLRSRLSGNMQFSELLQQTRETVSKGISHAEYPFAWMLEWAEAERDPRFSPVFQIMFNMLSFTDPSLQFSDLEISYRGLETGYTKYDLSLYAQEHGDGIDLQFSYQTELFDGDTIDRMLRNFVILLENATRDPEACIDDLEYLHADERQFLLSVSDGTDKDYPLDESMVERLAALAAQQPDAPAYYCGQETLTYRDLNERSNQLAWRLKKLGVKAGARVAVCAERSFDLMIGLLAVPKAGGTYVVLDSDYPAQRRDEILQDTGAKVVILQEGLDQFAGDLSKVYLDRPAERLEEESCANLPAPEEPNPIFNIVYTSSSTGKPKGVLIPTRAVLNRLHWMWDEYPFAAADVAVVQKSASLVAAFWEVFGALLKGRPAVILTRAETLDSVLRWRRLVDRKVTYLLASPAFLDGILEQAERYPEEKTSLRLAATSAEPVSPGMVRCWQSRFPGVPLLNLYGATECASNALCYDATKLPQDSVRVPMGRPLANAKVFVLDGRLRPLPIGVIGELCVAGACVAKGYLNQPELTAECFVDPPSELSVTGKLYRTGDFARIRANGEVELVGRKDFQIKLRGFRIDPGEIEAALMSHDAVERCVVVLKQVGSDRSVLTAYLVSGRPESDATMKDRLRAHLPDYMIPTCFVYLDQFPLTSAGKIDRSSLPEPVLDRSGFSNTLRAPVTAPERVIAGIWREFLGRDEVGIDDNFFDLGGHSILATRMVSYVTDLYQIEIPLKALLDRPTIEGLVLALTATGGSDSVVAISEAFEEFEQQSDTDDIHLN